METSKAADISKALQDLKPLVNLVSDILGLKYRVKFSIHQKVKVDGVDVCGSYTSYPKYHRIKVSLTGERDPISVLLHELIHAWQTEYKPKSKPHGRLFQQKALEIQLLFPMLDYPLYIRGTDK
jgi:hypothetical protein